MTYRVYLQKPSGTYYEDSEFNSLEFAKARADVLADGGHSVVKDLKQQTIYVGVSHAMESRELGTI